MGQVKPRIRAPILVPEARLFLAAIKGTARRREPAD